MLAGLAAALARVCMYAGPPRARMVAFLDAAATMVLGFAAGELALWWTGSLHAAVGIAIPVAVLGWNEVQRWAWVARAKLGGGA